MICVRWKRSTGDYVESHDGRWQIVPLYCGRTRPEVYNLVLDGKVVSSENASQREAKESVTYLPDNIVDTSEPVILRIQDASNEPKARWIERYFLRDKAGRYRERKDIPGNHQYAPGNGEIIRWFRSMKVTHVEVAEGWHDTVKPGIYPLDKFARILRRCSKEAAE